MVSESSQESLVVITCDEVFIQTFDNPISVFKHLDVVFWIASFLCIMVSRLRPQSHKIILVLTVTYNIFHVRDVGSEGLWCLISNWVE